MQQTAPYDFIVGQDDRILVTGGTGFIGSRLVANLLDRGFRNLRCFARPSSKGARLEASSLRRNGVGVEVVTGNLLSREDCNAATKDVAVIFHPAAGRGEKSFPTPS
jgi:nucleoside-diphosphate-sugar epimerase